MAAIKVMITGATGMVGEGVLLECLQNEAVSDVLMVNRRHYEHNHPKLKELIVPDFFDLGRFTESIKGYDACFFCAGISSVGMKEETYTRITYDTTLAFAKALVIQNPGMVFTYVSGAHTDSTEKGRSMWARVKGKTENDLVKLPFKAVYNFRPGAMVPFPGQRNWNKLYKIIAKMLKAVAPKSVLAVGDVGRAMVNAVVMGYPKAVLEVADIRELAKQNEFSTKPGKGDRHGIFLKIVGAATKHAENINEARPVVCDLQYVARLSPATGKGNRSKSHNHETKQFS